MKKLVLSIAILSLGACSMADMKTSAVNAKNDFQSCAQEQALVIMLNPTTSSLPTKTMGKQIATTCQARLADSAVKTDDQALQIALVAISAAQAAKQANKVQ